MRVAVTLEQCWHRVPGGVARATLGAARALAERSDALGIDQVGVAARHRAPAPSPWEPPIEVRHLPLPRVALYEAWHALRRPVVERATGPIDVVHATAHVAAAATAPLVCTVHDLHFLHEPAHFTPRGVRVFTRFLALARAEAAVVICPSQATRADCLAAGLDESRLRVVPWGIDRPTTADSQVAADADADADAEADRRVVERHGLDGGPFVLFVGTVEPRKNVARLVAAVAALGRPDVVLALVGADGWGEQANGGGAVRRLGFVSPGDLAALYRSTAVVCYPSIREGFGLPVLEAMAHGAPVVTSAGTATAEVAGGAAVLVDPFDVDAIAGGLASVLGDPDRVATMRTAGRVRAATFSWDACAGALAEAYRVAAEVGRR